MSTSKIIVRYSAVDGFSKRRTFKTLAGARKSAQNYAGKYPEIGSSYAISGDGVVKITVQGCPLADLFGDAPAEPTEREIEIAMFGDGEALFACGYAQMCGFPSERMFNTKEDDAAREAAAREEDARERSDCIRHAGGDDYDDMPF